MYICICNQITAADLKENPQLRTVVGSCCGKCLSDGGDTDFDGASESLVDNSCDDDNVTL